MYTDLPFFKHYMNFFLVIILGQIIKTPMVLHDIYQGDVPNVETISLVNLSKGKISTSNK